MSSRVKMRKWVIVAAVLCCAVLRAQRLSDMTTPTPIPPGTTLVIGFLGGYERWDDEHRSIRQLTLNLRKRSGVYAESIANHNRGVALKLIRRALDTNRNGRLDPEERARARVILYGQSWGGAAAIATAEDLDKLGVPVLLTVQVDSVGIHDRKIPANVLAAVNYYQHDPLTIQGRQQISAADPAKTRILGNFAATYTQRSIDETNASWARRTFGGSHAKMELDPAIWSQVERYIVDAISRR
jgi:pimeloyl-ACP methyl ester carboxylesterase